VTVATKRVEEELITGEELLAMGDIGRSELIDGRIVQMRPTGAQDGVVELNVGFVLRQYVRDHNLGSVMVGEVGIYTRRDPDRVRAADVVFISRDRLSEPLQGFLEVAPELVVEIVSPSDAWQNMRQKIEEYLAIGADRVWIVEPDNRAVLVFRSTTDVQEFGEEDTLRGEGVLDAFEVRVADLFAV
jgi:Uma2 family endonuclease